MKVNSVYYYQVFGSGSFCMHTYHMLDGLNKLGIKIYSNHANYPYIIYSNDLTLGDILITSTSGNLRDFAGKSHIPKLPRKSYHIDGTDFATAGVDGFDSIETFKTNLDKSLQPSKMQDWHYLPSCVEDPQIPFVRETERDIDISFYSAHQQCGRDVIYEWLKEYAEGTPGVRIDTDVDFMAVAPINPSYPMGSCNTISPGYYEKLNRSYISINAPGGGVNTRKFFENIAAGCIPLNYVPENYAGIGHTTTNGDILKIIPDGIGFPETLVPSFRTAKQLFSELDRLLVQRDNDIGKMLQEWGLNQWTTKQKAEYFIKTCGLEIPS